MAVNRVDSGIDIGPKGPYRMLSVSKDVTRITNVIPFMKAAYEGQYKVEHIGNCESIAEFKTKLQTLQPNFVVAASHWTPAESDEIQKTAKAHNPNIRVMCVPPGLSASKGSGAVVEHVKAKLPAVLN